MLPRLDKKSARSLDQNDDNTIEENMGRRVYRHLLLCHEEGNFGLLLRYPGHGPSSVVLSMSVALGD